jgi:mRNA-degrading endonuclease RelE of RelBE toxin-antitoxin system
MPFQIVITPNAQQDLKALRAYDQRTILQEIRTQLTHEPTRVSRSRIKKLTQPAISQYRLRVGEFRVYYDVDEVSQHVIVVEVFEKGRNMTPGEGEP